MRLIWLLPTVVSSLVFALSTGHPSYLLLAAASVLATVAVIGLNARKSKLGQATPEQVRLVSVDNQWFFDGVELTKSRLLLNRALRKRVLEDLRGRSRMPDSKVLLEGLARAPTDLPRLGVSIDDVELGESPEPVELPWAENPHTLIVGPTGSGKSMLLLRLLADCQGIPGVRSWVLDFKHGEFEALTVLAAMGGAAGNTRIASSADSQAIAHLWQELFEALDWAGRRPNLIQRATEVVIIDEIGAALEQPDSRERILKLASQGRSAGVRLICAGQSTAGIPRALLANLTNRILVGQVDQADALVLSSRSESLGSSRDRHSAPKMPTPNGWLSGRLLNKQKEFLFPIKT
jgi:hypothetical protein